MNLFVIVENISKYNIDVDLRLISNYWNKWIVKCFGDRSIKKLGYGWKILFYKKFEKYLFSMKPVIDVFHYSVENNVFVNIFNLKKRNNLWFLDLGLLNLKLFKKMFDVNVKNFLLNKSFDNIKVVKYLWYLCEYKKVKMFKIIDCCVIKPFIFVFDYLGFVYCNEEEFDVNLIGYGVRNDIVLSLFVWYDNDKISIFKRYLLIFKRKFVNIDDYLMIFKEYCCKNKNEYNLDLVKKLKCLCDEI